MAAQLQMDRQRAARSIEFHYDVGNPFWERWLDPSMTYSCAMWDGLPQDAPLEEAQRNKLRYHASAVDAKAGGRILDVGCGWGPMLRMLVDEIGVDSATGLTLSQEQLAYVRGQELSKAQIELCNWMDYEPSASFDGVISMGAFEHFATPDQEDEERVEVYREFFRRCRDWLTPTGRLSLQTIAYGTMRRSEASSFMQQSIFPNAELPTLEEIVRAADGVMEIHLVRNDRMDYARTCEAWVRRLRQAGRSDPDFAASELARRYEHYMRLSATGFRMGKIGLLRLVMSPCGWSR
jgi:cyclopropane-fatty-acyl-phospholipid synthase